MRKFASVITALAVAAVLVACTPDEASHLEALNAFRSANGMPELAWEENAYDKARTWSQKMASDGRLSHSTLREGIPAGWRTLGENVAMSTTLDGAMTALQRSPGHRANMLSPRFTKVAIGVIHHDGRYWVTQFFMG